MSHFNRIKTRFQNLSYLEKALQRLKISYQSASKRVETSTINPIHLRISQRNGYDLEFAWNGKEYEMVVDISFWDQASPLETFLDQVTQKYAGEVILGESHKRDFQVINSNHHLDGSQTLVLERWNNHGNSKFY